MDHALLKDLDVFSAVDDEHLRRLAALAHDTSVPEGAAIVRQGQYSHDFFAIVEGHADVLRDGRRIATLTAGECFGEIGGIERTARSVTVVATTPMRLVTLTRRNFERLGSDALLAIRDQLEQRIVVDVE